MAKIKWLSSFDTGITEIDADHRELVNTITRIEDALEQENIEAGSVLFREFLSQVAAHFKREEAFLISIDYPRLEAHSQCHRALMESGKKTLKKVEAGMDSEKSSKYLEEMVYFLLEDVIKADAEFRTYAQEKGAL